MEPSIHEYVYQGPSEPIVDLFGRFDELSSGEACVAIAVAGALMLAVTVARERRGVSGNAGWGAFAIASLLLLAMYGLTWGLIDEVAIALEHSFNLYHSGRFSFSPTRMVDGTVEHVYYLLLVPFAGTAERLVAANFWLGLVIAWAHLWLIAGLVRDCRPSTRAAVLLLYAAHYPIVMQLSNGFGNSLVSLVFLAAIRVYFSDRLVPAVALAAVLPLLRPDAILYSYALLFAMHTGSRESWTWRSLLRWALPAAALGVFLVLHHAVYGHWVPTPVAFKSIHPAMLKGEHLRELAGVVLNYVSAPPRMLGILALVAGAALVGDRARLVRRLAIPMALVAAFYMLSWCLIEDSSGDTFERYWIGLDQTLFLAVVVLLAGISSQALKSRYPLIFGGLAPATIVLLVWSGVTANGERQNMSNRDDLAAAGRIATRVIPASLSLATTELNTFGLAIADREVIDLVGFTEPAIANSRILNGLGFRNNPAWFQVVRPDVFFVYEERSELSDVEQFLAQSGASGKDGNLLGDMEKVLDAYDVVLIRHPHRDLVLLVKRTSHAELDRSLQAAAFAKSADRPLDRARFHTFYDRIPLRQVRF